MTRVAVVGAGRVSAAHLDALRRLADVEVVAVCDPALDRAQRAARAAGVPHAVASVAELAPLGVQLAHVLVPPDLHVRVARDLLEAGIGVLVEKPLALSSAEARDLGELARVRGLPLGVNHNAVEEPSFRRLLARVRSGEVGHVRHVQMMLSIGLAELRAPHNVTSWMLRAPRNIVFEVGPHPFSHLLELVGPVRSATTTVLGTRRLGTGQTVPDRFVVAAAAERGTAELFVALNTAATLRTVRVLGTDGSLEVRLDEQLVAGDRHTPRHPLLDRFAVGWRLGGELQRDSVRLLARDLGPVVQGDGDLFATIMRASVKGFHDAVTAGEPVPFDVEHGARVVEWCEAAAAGLPADPIEFPALPDPGPPRPGEVVVLGANGLIGLRTVDALLARGLPVTAVVRRSRGLPPTLTSDGVRVVVASLEDHGSLDRAVQGARAVLHLATGAFDTPEDIAGSMVGGTVALARACQAHGVQRLVYVSSVSALYLGRDAGYEVVDDALGVDPQPEHRNLYVQGKIAVEAALAVEHRERGLPVVVARPGIVLGPGAQLEHAGLGEWVHGRYCLGWGPGDRPLPVVLVDDVADALARLVEYHGDDLDGRAINLAADVDLTARDLVAELRRVTGRPLEFRPRSFGRMHAVRWGRWLLKTAARRAWQPVPSLRDAMSMEHYPRIRSDRARAVLGWTPVEEREPFLNAAVRQRPSA